MSILSECVRRASSVTLTMFPLKSMLGNFLLMYLMAVSMPLSASKGRRVFGSAQACDKRHHDHVYWMMNNFAFINSLNSELPGDLGSAIRTALVWLSLTAAASCLVLLHTNVFIIKLLLLFWFGSINSCSEVVLVLLKGGQQIYHTCFLMRSNSINSCVQKPILFNIFLFILRWVSPQTLFGLFLGLRCLG